MEDASAPEEAGGLRASTRSTACLSCPFFVTSPWQIGMKQIGELRYDRRAWLCGGMPGGGRDKEEDVKNTVFLTPCSII